MSKWFLRGLVFAALMVVVRLVQGVLINAFESKAGLISLALVALFLVPVLLWGLSDGRADARANPDPDRREDLAMTWLGAGLAAGLLSGLACWIIGLLVKSLYVSTFFNELTSFAAFTALLVFVPGVAAVALGRRGVDKGYAKTPVRHHGLAATGAAAAGADAPDTDVFASVGALPTAAEAAAQTATTPDADATLGGAATGFTTEEIPAAADDTPETPAG